LHIQFHLKTSDDLEIYEIGQTSKEKLEEILDLRQPVLFHFDSNKIIETTNKTYISKNYDSFDVKIRNIYDNNDKNNNDKNNNDNNVYDNDNDDNNINKNNNSDLYVPLSLKVTNKLLQQDKQGSYFSENNSDFLQETGLIKQFRFNDNFLRPSMVSNCYYDILFGSNNVFTPFRYEINYRNFFLVTQGSVQIKVSPPHNKKHLYTEYDYENFEFSSPINPWVPQKKYSEDFNKVKCSEFTLTTGKVIFIPAYWWYSIRFLNNDSSVSCFRYRTYMNNVAISNHIGLHLLQMQNIKSVTNQITQKMSVLEEKAYESSDNKLHVNTDSIESTTTHIDDLEQRVEENESTEKIK
jgi:hypothetical protein